jgi:hypothetical protein
MCVWCVCVVEMQWYGAIGAINGTKVESVGLGLMISDEIGK